MEEKGRSLCVLVNLHDWDGGVVTRRRAGGVAGDAGGKFAIIAIVHKAELEDSGRVGAHEIGVVLSVKPVGGVDGPLQGKVSAFPQLPEDRAGPGPILIVDLDDPVLVANGDQEIAVVGR